MRAIETENLFFSYRTSSGVSSPILKGVNLHVEPGELVALRGPSGSGKSTLLYLLSGLLGPYQGKVRIEGQDLSQLSDTELARLRNKSIGFVFQQFYLMPKRTLLENIELAAEYGGPYAGADNALRTERARDLAQQLGLDERLSHFPNQLSGGQQQRVAIARALFNDPRILLADEPTGSLDTQTSEAILAILRQTVAEGRSALVITHDLEVASRCDRTILFRDGKLEESSGKTAVALMASLPSSVPRAEKRNFFSELLNARQVSGGLRNLLPSAARNLLQNKSRSALTMVGIVIGIAAILSMLTIGKFTEKKILESYAELGVNTLSLHGWPNWELKATDKVPSMFQAFDWNNDIKNLGVIFPQIRRVTPMMMQWNSRAGFGGKSVDAEVRVMGVSADGLEIMNRKLLLGNTFSPVHVDQRMPVCVLGNEIFTRLFPTTHPIGQIVHVSQPENSFGCRVIGVLKSQSSNKEWNKPNLQILVPYTYLQTTTDPWSARMRELAFQVHAGSDIEKVGKGIKAFFFRKYGKSGRFIVGNDSILLAQMKKFLKLFTLLLGVIALVSVGVGGIGIMNMMLVSVSERLKEIGIRKAFGATHAQIRLQYLLESVLICTLGGALGLLVGFAVYELGIYGASQLMPTLKFEWVFDPSAIIISITSIVGVGILSGIVPAIKAERLEVIEALRND